MWIGKHVFFMIKQEMEGWKKCYLLSSPWQQWPVEWAAIYFEVIRLFEEEKDIHP